MSLPVFIFSDFKSKRLNFTLKLIFEQLLGVNFEFTDLTAKANIVFSENQIYPDVINIPICSNLLSNTGIENIDLKYKYTGEKTILFPNYSNQINQLDFDIFSAIFYLVSRYEEYSNFKTDVHNRFPPEESILHKTESFEFPMVNIWINKLKNDLLKKFPYLKFNEPKFRFISTIDIDSTFRYKEKGFLWTISGLIKDLINFKFYDVSDRIKIIANLKPDSFDVYDRINRLHAKYKTEVIFFWLLGNYGKFDKNINWKNSEQRKIIRENSKNNKIGLHPSYKSNFDNQLLKIEKSRLENICDTKIEYSRQHFLMHRFPYTYQNLIKEGIKHDFTLGYTSQYGFRAGIASPFYFYDLHQEIETDLLLYPFCSMDITPMHYYKLSPNQAIEKNCEMLNKVKNVNGAFISLWHNESISGTTRWQGGWDKVYLELIKYAAELQRG
ncbi:MAG: polysaccharide deacetylase family protein [Bacteroidia bacterium]|nr:polysaccharide deacetylase family protein [Bacteroidia bacterium]